MELDAVYAQRLQRMRNDLTTLTSRVDTIETTLISMRLSPNFSRDRQRSPRPEDPSSPPRPTTDTRLDQFLNRRLWTRLGRQMWQAATEKITGWVIGLVMPIMIVYGHKAWGWVSPAWSALRSLLGF